MTIVPVQKADHPRLLAIWEASVRATHDFLSEAEIQVLKPLLLHEYLDAVDLAAVREASGSLVGFLGTLDRKIEMLFVAPERRGEGVGRLLVEHAVDRLGCDSVDVNERNPQALGFYLRMGFRVAARSERDGQGNPHPLLHLTLADVGSVDG